MRNKRFEITTVHRRNLTVDSSLITVHESQDTVDRLTVHLFPPLVLSLVEVLGVRGPNRSLITNHGSQPKTQNRKPKTENK